MEKYEVNITDEALDDMEKIYEYIAFELLSPENAMGQYNRIADAILTLDLLPDRFALFESEPEHSRGMRRMVVDILQHRLLLPINRHRKKEVYFDINN